MLCVNCNTTNEDDSAFCIQCGKQLHVESSINYSQKISLLFNWLGSQQAAFYVFGLPILVVLLSITLASAFPASGLASEVKSWGSGNLIFLTLPLIIGWGVVLFKPISADQWGSKFDYWILTKQENAFEGSGKFDVYIGRPLFAGLVRISNWATKFEDVHTQLAVKLTVALYFAMLVFYVVMWVIALILFLLCLRYLPSIIGFFEKLGGLSSSNSNASNKSRGFFGGQGTESRERTGFFGDKYIETRDSNGNVISESRDRNGFFGDKYIETRDSNGYVISESRDRTDFFGDDYTEHRDESGSVVGESRDRTDFFGSKYTETKKRG